MRASWARERRFRDEAMEATGLDKETVDAICEYYWKSVLKGVRSNATCVELPGLGKLQFYKRKAYFDAKRYLHYLKNEEYDARVHRKLTSLLRKEMEYPDGCRDLAFLEEKAREAEEKRDM